MGIAASRKSVDISSKSKKSASEEPGAIVSGELKARDSSSPGKENINEKAPEIEKTEVINGHDDTTKIPEIEAKSEEVNGKDTTQEMTEENNGGKPKKEKKVKKKMSFRNLSFMKSNKHKKEKKGGETAADDANKTTENAEDKTPEQADAEKTQDVEPEAVPEKSSDSEPKVETEEAVKVESATPASPEKVPEVSAPEVPEVEAPVEAESVKDEPAPILETEMEASPEPELKVSPEITEEESIEKTEEPKEAEEEVVKADSTEIAEQDNEVGEEVVQQTEKVEDEPEVEAIEQVVEEPETVSAEPPNEPPPPPRDNVCGLLDASVLMSCLALARGNSTRKLCTSWTSVPVGNSFCLSIYIDVGRRVSFVMGNQLGAIAPSEIFPVEHYLTRIRGLSYDSSLGSTRFLKVARAKVDDVNEGWVTVKVFVIHDPSLPLKPHISRLKDLRDQLKAHPNCMPYEVLGVSDKSAIIYRPYFKYSLYDRINTRPFMLPLEKAWFAYQLLRNLEDLHHANIFHGDLKTENIMISSWQSMFFTDFASFKPVQLPVDNPADFAYFFDTSGKRKCYIAPERFVEALAIDDDLAKEQGLRIPSSDQNPHIGGYHQSMDMFSAGCVLAEVFTEGECLFELSQLLAFKYGKYHPEQILSLIEDPHCKQLVGNLICIDPCDRLSANAALETYVGTIFPDYFEYWFKFVRKTFDHASNILDDKMSIIKESFHEILKHFGEEEEQNVSNNIVLGRSVSSLSSGEDYFEVHESQGWRLGQKNSVGLVLVASVVTASIRGLHFCGSRLVVLELLEEISRRLPDDLVLDRIVPFMVELVKDESARVRCEALNCLTRCLSGISLTDLHGSDANVFPEFIFPGISATVTDLHSSVRCSLAANIGLLAETAARFIENVELNCASSSKSWDSVLGNVSGNSGVISSFAVDSPRWKITTDNTSYESLVAEKRWVQDWVKSKVSALLTDPDNSVKITLMRKNLTRLCIFFGRNGANDIIFSHMITFLNDKDDTKLRLAFYDTVVGIVSYIGRPCCNLLKPLLLQIFEVERRSGTIEIYMIGEGLRDTEEFVIAKAVWAMMSLVDIGLLDKYIIYDLAAETAPYLCHPNPWIRQSVVGFFASVMCMLSPVDVNAKIMPRISPYTRAPVGFARDVVVLWDFLKEPIGRLVFYQLLRVPNLSKFVKRLYSDGLGRDGCAVLLAMKENLLRMHRPSPSHKSTSMMGPVDMETVIKRTTDLYIGPLKRSISPPWEHRSDDVFSEDRKTSSPASMVDTGGHASFGGGSLNANMNREWQHMFGDTQKADVPLELSVSPSVKDTFLGPLEPIHVLDTVLPEKSHAPLDGSTVGPPVVWNPSESASSDESSLRISQDKSLDNRCKPCRSELKELLKRRVEEIQDSLTGLQTRSTGVDVTSSTSSSSLGGGSMNESALRSWVPAGKLVYHVGDHRECVTKLFNITGVGDGGMFASSSNDGTVRLWDATLDNLRNRLIYNSGVPVRSGVWCSKEEVIATLNGNGTVDIFGLDTCSSKRPVLTSRSFNVDTDGMGMELLYVPTASVLIYVTAFGVATGWDLRTRDEGFRIIQNLSN
ncbi:unnamed protein product, partial [Notodromas monacha]